MRTRTRTTAAAWCAALLGLALVGCDDEQTPAGEGVTGEADTGDTAGVDADTAYDCFGVGGTAQEIATAPPLSDFAHHPGYDTFLAETGGDVEGWVVLDESGRHLGAIRELSEPDELEGDVRTHERAGVELVPAASLPDADEDTWMLSTAGNCALQAMLDGIVPGTVELDPDALPKPDDTEVVLLVTERSCAGGKAAHGRVELAGLESTDEQVRLVIGVRPAGGVQTCPSNPPTQVTVELPEPLGDRDLVDAAVLPPRPIGISGGGPGQGR